MRHFASPKFWEAYRQLPEQVRALADKNYALLKRKSAASVFGFWIGSHADYDAMIG
jgi:hypothetical protein